MHRFTGSGAGATGCMGYTCPGAGVIACTGSHALELGSQDAWVHMHLSRGPRMHGFTCSGAGATGCTGTHALELGS